MRGEVRKTSGFTLMELLLAMGVTCIIAVTLFASLRVALKARDSAQSMMEPARAAQVALDLIGQDLESALPPPPSTTGTTTSLIEPFEGVDGGDGTGDTLEYFAVNSGNGNGDADPTRGDGVKKIDLDVESVSNDGSLALVRKVTHNLLAPVVPDPDVEVLCRNVVHFNIRYLSNDIWNDSWDSTAQGDTLPVAVEVSFDIQRPANSVDKTPYHALRVFYLAGANQ